MSAWQWQALVGVLVTFAVIPGAAAISASTLFAHTLACSPAFQHGQLSGNLIGTNGGWAYMVEYRSDYSEDYFSVAPLANVRLMTRGNYADCATLANTPAPAASMSTGAVSVPLALRVFGRSRPASSTPRFAAAARPLQWPHVPSGKRHA